MKLEIGGGSLVEEGWVNLDCRNGDGEFRRLAQDVPWPLADNSVDEIRAFHVMEHIPAGQPRIDVMNEAWRVLKPDGRFEIRVPLMVVMGHECGKNVQRMAWPAIADPTHVSFWVAESFSYFTGKIAACADYEIKMWCQTSFVICDDWEGRWVGMPVLAQVEPGIYAVKPWLSSSVT